MTIGNRKNILKGFKKIILFFVLVLFVVIPKFTFADLTNYTTLVSLPEIGSQTNFQEWLPKAFNLTIGIAVALAFVMITIGGVMYATSDAIYSKSEGRKYVENALIGLLFVIGAYVILYTINPQILNFNLTIEAPQVSAPAGQTTTTGGTVGGSTLTDTEVRLQFSSGVTARPQCQPGGTTSGCTNLNGIQQVAINGINGLQATCNCNIIITSGTEGKHTTGSAHYSGLAFDFLPSAELKTAIVGPNAPATLPACFVPINRGPVVGRYLWEPKGSYCGGEVASTADHWHVSY